MGSERQAEGALGLRTGAALALAWAVLVPLFWWGLFVASMRADAPRAEAVDLYGYFFPKFVHGSAALARGELPLWNPHEYAGVPLLGAAQPAVLYPPRVVLFALLPPRAALHAFMVTHYLLLGLGAFLMLRALRLGPWGAVLGTLLVVFQPLVMHGHYHPIRIAGFAWVPFVVAAFVHTLERPGFAPALGLALAAALQALAGYPEYSWDTALGLAVMAPFVAAEVVGATGPGRRLRTLAWGVAGVAGAALLAAALSAMQWVALADMFRGSVRAAGEAEWMPGLGFDLATFGHGLGGWVSALGLLFAPPPLAWVLLAWGLAAPRARYRGAMLAFAALAAGALWVVRDLPPFSMFRGPLCWDTMLHLPLAAVAAAGFDRALAVIGARATGGTPPPVRNREVLAIVLALVAVVPVLRLRSLAWLVAGALPLVLACGRSPRAVRLTGAVAVATMLGWVATWVPARLPPSLPHRYAGGQPHYPRVEEYRERARAVRAACGGGTAGRVLAPAESLAGVPVVPPGLHAVQGYPESLPPERMTRLLDAAGLAPRTLWPLDWARLARARGVLDLLDVSCAIVGEGGEAVFTQLGYQPGPPLDRLATFVRRDGSPFFLPRAVRVAGDPEAALAAVLAPDFDPEREAILEEEAAPFEARTERSGDVLIHGDTFGPDLRLRVTVPDGAYLVVPQSWYPGWRAAVDGHPARVLRADYALLAVGVAPGAHEVALWYRPPGFTLATALAAAGTALVLVGGLVLGWRRARGRARPGRTS